MKILLIDNFDSFTFNLSHYLEGMGAQVDVMRENDYQIGDGASYDRIVLSPGSGLPQEREGMMLCISENIDVKPILGVCLGMQALVEHTNGSLYNQDIVKHGVSEKIERLGESLLLNDIPEEFEVGLYHSWAVDVNGSEEWQITSKSSTGIVMSIEAKNRKLFGVQFHPESIMTNDGKKILANFLGQ